MPNVLEQFSFDRTHRSTRCTKRPFPDYAMSEERSVIEFASSVNRQGENRDLKDERENDRAAPHLPAASKAAWANLHGPLRLTLPDGRVITPGSPLRQAILAVLIMAPNQTKARRSLQDMFWARAERDRATANLRTALYLLKRDLAELGEDTLVADRNTVALLKGRILKDPGETSEAQFLEGLDLPLDDCEGFEDWLRIMRGTTSDAIDVSHDSCEAPKIIKTPSSRPIALAILPTIEGHLQRRDVVRVNSIMDAIVRSISQTSSLDIHDLRGFDVQTISLPIESGCGPTHLLQPIAEKNNRRLMLGFRLVDTGTRRLSWSAEPIDAYSNGADAQSAAITETLLEHLASSQVAENTPDLFAWTAMTALFSLDDATIQRTETQIAAMRDSGGPRVLECLSLFAQVFKENEGVEAARKVDPSALCEILAEVPNWDPMLPLWQSLAGYSAHMLLGENDLAELMLESALRRAPNLAINLDHLAVLRMTRGDLEGAEAALSRCLIVGANSPWRYTYDVTGSMISMARGDYRKALQFANRALMRKPRFIGALRYAMAGFALAENHVDAQRMKSRIRRLRPDYDIGAWTENMVRRTPNQLAQNMAESFRRNGIL